jgi:hypothetical protein
MQKTFIKNKNQRCKLNCIKFICVEHHAKIIILLYPNVYKKKINDATTIVLNSYVWNHAKIIILLYQKKIMILLYLARMTYNYSLCSFQYTYPSIFYITILYVVFNLFILVYFI